MPRQQTFLVYLNGTLYLWISIWILWIFKLGKILSLLIGIRSLTLLRSRCRKHHPSMSCDLCMFRFMITFDTSFPMGKAHGWAGTFPKHLRGWAGPCQCLILCLLRWECPHHGGFSPFFFQSIIILWRKIEKKFRIYSRIY